MSKQWTKAQWDGNSARWDYLIQWKDARKYPEGLLEVDIPLNYENLTPGERSWLMRDQIFDGWGNGRLQGYWVDRLMVLRYGEDKWWEKRRTEREAYIRMRRHWLNIKEDHLNRD